MCETFSNVLFVNQAVGEMIEDGGVADWHVL
jgi:hypothetical protein